jgi:hypothetical protein
VAIFAETLLEHKLFIAENFKRQFSHADPSDSSIFAIRPKKTWAVDLIQEKVYRFRQSITLITSGKGQSNKWQHLINLHKAALPVIQRQLLVRLPCRSSEL